MEETKTIKLVGVGDLVKRWGYTKQAIHRRIKLDKKFPKHQIINGRTLVFYFDDVLEYEKTRKGIYLGDGFKQYLKPEQGRHIASIKMQTYDEWQEMSEEEKAKHN